MADLNIEAERALYKAWCAGQHRSNQAEDWEVWLASAAARAAVPAQAGATEPVDVEFKRLSDTILQATTNGARLEALRGMAALFDAAAQPPAQGLPSTYTVDGVVMSPLEYIDYLHGQLKAQGEHSAGVGQALPKCAAYGYVGESGFDPHDGHKQLIGVSVQPGGTHMKAREVKLYTEGQVKSLLSASPGDGEHSGRVAVDPWPLIEKIAKQKPEKPDYWSGCGQCERNIEAADELVDARAAAHKAPQERGE